MGKKLNKKINELRVRVAAGDKTAMSALQALLYVPSYLQRMVARDPMKNAQRYQTTHAAKKSGRGLPCTGTIGAVEELPFRVARLQMLRTRKERRNVAA
jgi:hypothetical protein